MATAPGKHDLLPNCKSITYKVALAGKYGAGKTSIFRRMFNMGFDGGFVSGIDKEVYRVNFEEDNTVIELEVWDTAEMEKHRSVTQSHYKGCRFVLLVYSMDDEGSLEELERTAKDVKKYEASARLFLVRNKIDLPADKEEVSIQRQDQYVDEMIDSNTQIHAVFPTSAKDDQGIKELLETLANQALQLSKGRSRLSQSRDPGLGFQPYLEPQKQSCCS